MFFGLLLAVFLGTAAPARAASDLYNGWTPLPVAEFGGLNLLNDSTQIGTDAQVAKNVLTDSGFLEMRPGNVKLTTLLPGFPTRYVNDWLAPTGNRFLVAQSSNTVFYTDFSGAAVVLSTVPTGYNITTTPAFSKLFFADGSRVLWDWDGVSTATVAGAPICTYLAYKDGRIFCGNIPDEGSSRVRISSEGGANFWAVPPDVATVDNAPNLFDFTPYDGDQITCMAATPWGVFVGKRHSSHMIKGTGNLTYDLRVLDPRVGCIDNRTVQMVYGVLIWLGIDGVYAYDGTGPPQILSRELDPVMKVVRQSVYSENQWVTQLKADWQTGVSSPTGSWTASDFNEFFPSSYTLFDDNTDPVSQVGIGFSSDTLVYIDTVTHPASLGYATLAVSTYIGTPYLWSDNFGDGDYTSGSTTWTVVAGGFAINAGALGGKNWLMPTSVGLGNTAYTTKPAARNYQINYYFDGASLGNACENASTVCMLFEFWAQDLSNYYALRVDQNSAASSGKTVYLIKSVGGSANAIASYSTTMTGNTQYLFEVRVSTYIEVWMNGVFIMAAYESPASNFSNLLGVIHLSYVGPGSSRNFVTDFASNYYHGSGSIVSRIFDTGMVHPLAGAWSSTYTLTSDGQTQLASYVRSSTSPNNDMWTSWQASSNSVVAVLPFRYWQYEDIFTTSVATETPRLQSVQLLAITTGVYYSRVNYIGSGITSWKQFSVTESNPGGFAYYVRVSSLPFGVGSATPTWSSQTVGQNVNASTGSYVEYKIDSSGLSNADQTSTLSAIFLRWAEGVNIPAASATLDRRYLLCVTISTSAIIPDRCYLRQKTGKWVEWSGPSVGAVGLYNDNIVVADGGTSGDVWKALQVGVFDDAGVTIDSQWVSADFTGGHLFNEKILHGFWVDALPVSASSVTVSYQVDKSSGFNDHTFSLDTGQPVNTTLYPYDRALYGAINHWVPLTSGYDKGRYIRTKFSNNGLSNYWRVNGYILLVEVEPMQFP